MIPISDLLSYGMFCTSIVFNEDSVEMTFLEDTEQGEGVMVARTMVLAISTEERQIVYGELQERLRELIEWGYDELRHPPQPREQRSVQELMVERRLGQKAEDDD